MNESGFNDFVAEAKSRATLAAELQAKTVDQITPGEQQPEVEHDFKSENSESEPRRSTGDADPSSAAP